MLNYIRKYRFEKALQSHANYSRKVDVRSINLGATVAVLSRWEHREAVRRLVAEAADSINDVTILYYSELELAESMPSQEQVYTRKMLKHGIVPTGESIDLFLGKEYDRLFFVDTAIMMQQEFILRLAKCRLCIGPLQVGGDHLFDFSIDIQQKSVSYFVDEVIRALDHMSK